MGNTKIHHGKNYVSISGRGMKPNLHWEYLQKLFGNTIEISHVTMA